MTVFRKRAPFARGVALALFVLYLPACTSWRAQSFPAQAVIRDTHPQRIRLTRLDGSRVEIANPRIVGDSIVGTNRDWGRLGRGPAVALDDIRLVETRETNGEDTALLVVGLGVAALAVVAIVAAAAQDDPPPRRPTTDPYISCPLVYSWDGEAWRLDSGTFGGAITRAATRTDVDNLVYATPDAGRLRLKLANELDETDHVDALSVLVVDHDPDVTVAPDGDGNLHSLGKLQTPLGASDFRGRDVLQLVAAVDELNWQSAPFGRSPDRPEDIRDGLVLEFVRPAGVNAGKLVIDGRNTTWASYMLTELIGAHGTATDAWYDSLDTQPRFRQQFASLAARTGFLGVSVHTAAGWEHQGYVWEAGPEIAKRQVFPLDLSQVRGDTVRVRLESAPSFWLIDQVALDYTTSQPFTVQEINATQAIDHAGRDVRHLLAAVDEHELVMETGDYVELQFDLPPVEPGKTRSFVLQSTGWYRVHTSLTAAPQITLLRESVSDRDAGSRISVRRMNEAWKVYGVRTQ